MRYIFHALKAVMTVMLSICKDDALNLFVSALAAMHWVTLAIDGHFKPSS